MNDFKLSLIVSSIFLYGCGIELPNNSTNIATAPARDVFPVPLTPLQVKDVSTDIVGSDSEDPTTVSLVSEQWQLIWQDEFNDNNIDAVMKFLVLSEALSYKFNVPLVGP